jgi:hypothetical protein
MSESLPLVADNPSGETDRPPTDARQAATGVVEIFDPPMCCSTGLCGPGVDPALLAISRDLRWLEKHGAQVRRVGLSTDPTAFVQNERVAGLMQAFGDGALPATLVNGNVLVHGRYPTRDELTTALATQGSRELPTAKTSSCCTPGSGCC